MMERFGELGRDLEQRWRAHDYDEVILPELAAEVLLRHAPARHVDPVDIVEHLVEQQAAELPFPVPFAQPPVTLFRSQRLYVEALFWMSATTSVHQHAFAGAFQVLAGSSLHTRYRWHERRVVNPTFSLGRLEHEGSELLAPGDTRSILPGPAMIHSLFHLELPSVTIVARSFEGRAPQHDYRGPCVAVDPAYRNHLLGNQIDALKVLWKTDPAAGRRLTARLLATADLESTYHVLQAASFAGLSRPDLDAIHEAVAERHVPELPGFLASFAELRRRSEIVQRRALVEDPEHMLLLGILLDAPTREHAEALVRARVGGEPRQHIARWLGELVAQPVGGTLGPNVLGLELDAVELRVLELMLDGCELPVLVERLRAELDGVDDQLDALAALHHGLRTAPILRPLLAA